MNHMGLFVPPFLIDKTSHDILIIHGSISAKQISDRKFGSHRSIFSLIGRENLNFQYAGFDENYGFASK